MGSGVWSAQTYTARASQRGGKDAFQYRGRVAHPTLNPLGLKYRESRDGSEHPESNSIMVGLDVSGSMQAVVRSIHLALPQLLGLLLGRQYIRSPQIMFSAFGNGTCDAVPLQVGQFESDNRMDQNLENMVLGGGCDSRESAELILYAAARHTAIDCFEKRQRKGYLFLITDEMAYLNVKKDEIKRIVGVDLPADIPLETIVAETQNKYNVFVIIPMGTESGRNPRVHEFYRAHFGPQNVILLDNADDVSKIIALTIGMLEGTIGLDDGIEDLKQAGSDDKSAASVKKALADTVVKGSGKLGDGDAGPRTRRL